MNKVSDFASTPQTSPMLASSDSPSNINRNKISEIQENLREYYQKLISEPNKTEIENILIELETFAQDKNYAEMKQNLQTSNLNLMRDASSGAFRIPKYRLPLLNWFAYLCNIPTLVILCDIITEQQLEFVILEDENKNDLLDIGIALGDYSLLVVIIRFLAKVKPKFGTWRGLTANKITDLMEMKIAEVGLLLDSRLFKVEISNDIKYSHSFSRPKTRFYDNLPNEKDIQRDLKSKKAISRKTGKKSIMVEILDIPEMLEHKDNINKVLRSVWYNYSGFSDIYKSRTVLALVNHKFFTYGLYAQLKEGIIFAFEAYMYRQLCVIFFLNCKECNYEFLSSYNVYLALSYYIICYLFINELKELYSSRFGYFLKWKNILDVLYAVSWTLFSIGISLVFHKHYFRIDYPMFIAFAQSVSSIFVVLLCLKGVYISQMFEFIGSMIRIVIFSIFYSVKLFIVVVILVVILTLGLGQTFYAKANVDGSAQSTQITFYTFLMIFGDSSEFRGLQDEYPGVTWLLYAYYLVASVVFLVMLNLLITVIGEGYGEVKEQEKNFAIQTMLDVCLDIDDNNQLKFRKPRVKKTIISRVQDFAVFCFYSIFLSKIIVDLKNSGRVFAISTIMGNDDLFALRNKKEYININEEVKHLNYD